MGLDHREDSRKACAGSICNGKTNPSRKQGIDPATFLPFGRLSVQSGARPWQIVGLPEALGRYFFDLPIFFRLAGTL
jgi:hypothetical protein